MTQSSMMNVVKKNESEVEIDLPQLVRKAQIALDVQNEYYGVSEHEPVNGYSAYVEKSIELTFLSKPLYNRPLPVTSESHSSYLVDRLEKTVVQADKLLSKDTMDLKYPLSFKAHNLKEKNVELLSQLCSMTNEKASEIWPNIRSIECRVRVQVGEIILVVEWNGHRYETQQIMSPNEDAVALGKAYSALCEDQKPK